MALSPVKGSAANIQRTARPGQWVIPPSTGVLWTPGYWGFAGGSYTWHEGYWGPQVGFYGGVNYGNGYFGSGFTG
jgi:hypothetical protein